MVMVSHDHEFVFLKTRKTAGTSVELFLRKYCAPDGVSAEVTTPTIISDRGIVGCLLASKAAPHPPGFIDFKADPALQEWQSHARARRVRRLLGTDLFDRYRKLAIVRNPFARCVSYYFFRLWNQQMTVPGTFSELIEDFSGFLTSPASKNDKPITHIQGRMIIDDFIRFENLRPDLDRVLQSLGIPPDPRPLPVAKQLQQKREKRPIADYYTPKSIDAVKSRMAWVFDNFDYPTSPDDIAGHHKIQT